MFRNTSERAAGLLGLAVLACLAVPGAASAQGATMRLNVGCPPASEQGKYTLPELRELCFGDKGPGDSPAPASKPQAQNDTGGSGALTCGQVKSLALSGSRASAGKWPEGQAANAAYESSCQGVSDNSLPNNAVAYKPKRMDGVYSVERGYNHPNPGVKRSICEPMYTGEVEIRNGSITFESGGHSWSGSVTSNSWIKLDQTGVFPTPKTPTSIIGPLTGASLSNGYCGTGFFRLGPKIRG